MNLARIDWAKNKYVLILLSGTNCVYNDVMTKKKNAFPDTSFLRAGAKYLHDLLPKIQS